MHVSSICSATHLRRGADAAMAGVARRDVPYADELMVRLIFDHADGASEAVLFRSTKTADGTCHRHEAPPPDPLMPLTQCQAF